MDELDPIYFDRAYFVAPAEGSARPYQLLYQAMRKSGKIALAQFVMRERQYLCAIRIFGDGLILHTMHYVDEVESIDDSLPKTARDAKPASKEVDVAIQLIDSMARKLDLSEFHDKYREELEELVERKKHGETVKVEGELEEKPLAKTVNLMDALRRSLKSGGPAATNGRHSRQIAVRRPQRRKSPAKSAGSRRLRRS